MGKELVVESQYMIVLWEDGLCLNPTNMLSADSTNIAINASLSWKGSSVITLLTTPLCQYAKILMRLYITRECYCRGEGKREAQEKRLSDLYQILESGSLSSSM